MAKASWTTKCPGCGRRVGRALNVEKAATVGDNDEYWSVSMGAAAVDRLAGEHYDDVGRVRVQGRSHKRRLMKKLGMREA